MTRAPASAMSTSLETAALPQAGDVQFVEEFEIARNRLLRGVRQGGLEETDDQRQAQ